MKKSVLFGSVIILLLIFSVFSYGLFAKPIYQKVACEISGGLYIKSASSTGGVFYYCDCPTGKYQTSEKVCEEITQTEIEKCQALSNDYVICEDDGKKCNCVFKNSGSITFMEYNSLVECDCSCNEDSCGCMCMRSL